MATMFNSDQLKQMKEWLDKINKGVDTNMKATTAWGNALGSLATLGNSLGKVFGEAFANFFNGISEGLRIIDQFTNFMNNLSKAMELSKKATEADTAAKKINTLECQLANGEAERERSYW